MVQQLKAINQQLAEIKSDSSKQASIFDLDRSFHRLIVESGAGPRLLAWHNTIEPQVERYWRLYASSIMNNLQSTISEHNDIIRGLTDGNADNMERSLQVNWENGCSRLLSVIDIFGERGSW